MFAEITGDCKIHRYQDHRYDDGGKDNVGRQHGEIKWPDDSLAGKWHITDLGVIGQVRDHEHGRDQ